MDEFGITDSLFGTLPEILIALLIGIIVTLIAVYFTKKKLKKRNVLITGLRDTGKTLLYSQLVHGHYVDTFTSMKENSGWYRVDANILYVIDIPGHERLRDKFFDKYKESARAILYIVDSSSIQKEVRDVAEYLYNLLSDPVILQKRLPFLIVCNKQDIPLSKNSKAVKSLLERELTTLLITKLNQLESVDPKSKRAVLLMRDSEKFDFARLSSNQVEFVDSYATKEKDGEANTEDLENWLLKNL